MSRRIIVETVLRDHDDATGQTVRSWRLENSDGAMTLTGGTGEDAHRPVSLRASDLPDLIADLERVVREPEEP